MFRLLTREKKPDRGVNASDLWLYARYQLLSRALIIIVLSPLYTMLINDLDPFRAMIASAGLEAAIAQGAQWSEINVQRTKDGHYIIHHDATFKRLAGEPRTAQKRIEFVHQTERVERGSGDGGRSGGDDPSAGDEQIRRPHQPH